MAVSLHLNMTAYALKMNNFNKTIVFCSLVLDVDSSSNVKTLCRRGIAFARSGNFEDFFYLSAAPVGVHPELYSALLVSSTSLVSEARLEFVSFTKGSSSSWI